MWAEDDGNVAKDTYGIDAVVILHPALPEMTADTDPRLAGLHGLLLVNDPATVEPYFPIVSVPQMAHDFWLFSEDDGLNLAGLKAGDEFVFIGAAMDGTPKRVWINRLGSVPLPAANLTPGHFATITAPTSLSNVTIPGTVTVSWSMPTAQTAAADWCNIGWGNGSDWTNMDKDNPAWGETWTSTTFDTSATKVSPASYMHVEITVSPDGNTDFTTRVSLH